MEGIIGARITKIRSATLQEAKRAIPDIDEEEFEPITVAVLDTGYKLYLLSDGETLEEEVAIAENTEKEIIEIPTGIKKDI